jgi:hypothetical protein
MKFLATTSVMAFVVSAAYAADAVATRNESLFGIDGASLWTLTSVSSMPAEESAMLHFEGQSLSLDVPCYRRSWAHLYNAGVSRFTNIWASEPRCGGAIPPVVARFDEVIPRVTALHVSADELRLIDAGGRAVMTATRLLSPGLENRIWVIEAYRSGAALVRTDTSPDGGTGYTRYPALLLRPHVTFMRGKLYGTPGCAEFSPPSNYRQDGSRVQIETSVLLTGYCPPQVIELSNAVENALRGIRVTQRDGERLILNDLDGRAVVVLAPWPAA